MKTIDYVYRFDPNNPSVKPPPPDHEAARKVLEDGNRMFSQWMESCRTSSFSTGEPRYVIQCNGLEVGMNRAVGAMPKQAPFAVVVGCSDARVPTEMLFGQGFNDLFVIRVAGNVLGDECQGSIDFALGALSESVKVLVVLGHSGCGAVKAAKQHIDSKDSLPGAINGLVELIKPAVAQSKGAPGDPLENAIRKNVEISVERLQGLQPILAPRVTQGKLKVVGAIYDLRTGIVTPVAS